MKRHMLIAKAVAIASILGATVFASSAQAQPPIVTPPQIAPDYDPLAGISQAQHDAIVNYILLRTLKKSSHSGSSSTGGLGGTSETFVDVQADGSYYDPSLARRVSIVDGRSAER
jgi:hypothetical protein